MTLISKEDWDEFFNTEHDPVIIETYMDLIRDEFDNICKMSYRFTASDGSKWDVPLMTIIINRAEYYAEVDKISLEESLNNDTLPLFRDDEDEIEDLARNNMDWSDVAGCAYRVEHPPMMDMNDEWTNPEDVEIV